MSEAEQELINLYNHFIVNDKSHADDVTVLQKALELGEKLSIENYGE